MAHVKREESQFSRTLVPVMSQMSNQSTAGYQDETVISPNLINKNNFLKSNTFYNCVELCQDFNVQSLKDIKMCTANSVSPKSHNGICDPRGNPFFF